MHSGVTSLAAWLVVTAAIIFFNCVALWAVILAWYGWKYLHAKSC
jgi:hypothetical protein